MSDITLDDAVSVARGKLDHMLATRTDLSRAQICELFAKELVETRPDISAQLAQQQLLAMAGYCVEVMEMIGQFNAAGRDPVPEVIAEEIIDIHRDGLLRMSKEDREFFLHYTRGALITEIADTLGETTETEA